MTRSRPARLAALSVLAIVVIACGGGASSGTSAPSTPPSTTPAASGAPSVAPSPSAATSVLLLKVTSEGGFINPSANLAALPIVAVYADGRIMTPGPVDAIYPGPLLAPVSVRDVGASGAAAILAAIRQVGSRPAGGVAVRGSPATPARTSSRSSSTARPPRPDFAGSQPGRPGPVASGRRGARRRARAARPPARSGRYMGCAGLGGDHTTSRPGIGSTSSRARPSAEPQASQSPVAWPLATPLADFGTPAVPDRGIAGLRQGVVTRRGCGDPRAGPRARVDADGVHVGRSRRSRSLGPARLAPRRARAAERARASERRRRP